MSNVNKLSPDMPSEEKIIESLSILKTVCEANDSNCEKCVLRTQSNECGLLFNSDGDYMTDLTHWYIYNENIPKRLLLH